MSMLTWTTRGTLLWIFVLLSSTFYPVFCNMLLKSGQMSEVEDYAKEVCYDNVLAYLKAGKNSTLVNKGSIGTTSIEITIKNLDLSSRFKGARVLSMPQVELQQFFSPASRRSSFFGGTSTDDPLVIVQLDVPLHNGTVQHHDVPLENPIIPIRTSYSKYRETFKCFLYSNILRANIVNLLNIFIKSTGEGKLKKALIKMRYLFDYRKLNALPLLTMLRKPKIYALNLLKYFITIGKEYDVFNNLSMNYFLLDYILKKIPELVIPNISVSNMRNCFSTFMTPENIQNISENVLKPALQEIISHGNKEDIKNIICLTLMIIPIEYKSEDLPNRLRMLIQVYLKEIPESTWDILIPQFKQIMFNDVYSSIIIILKIITATELVPPYIRLQTFSLIQMNSKP